MGKVAFFGAGGHAKVLVEIAELNGLIIDRLVEDSPVKESLLNYPVSDQMTNDTVDWIIAVGNNLARKQLSERFSINYSILTHPKANLSSYASLGLGTVIMGGVTINAGAKIGQHNIINTNASIDHDCVLGDFVHLSPNAALAGNVTVGEGTHIGIGACVIQGIRIGKWCTIGAGAVIIRDIPDGVTVVGNPGRIIKPKET